MNMEQYKLTNQNDSINERYIKVRNYNLEVMNFMKERMMNEFEVSEKDLELMYELKNKLEELMFKVGKKQ